MSDPFGSGGPVAPPPKVTKKSKVKQKKPKGSKVTQKTIHVPDPFGASAVQVVTIHIPVSQLSLAERLDRQGIDLVQEALDCLAEAKKPGLSESEVAQINVRKSITFELLPYCYAKKKKTDEKVDKQAQAQNLLHSMQSGSMTEVELFDLWKKELAKQAKGE
jgi:hypothetical protein